MKERFTTHAETKNTFDRRQFVAALGLLTSATALMPSPAHAGWPVQSSCLRVRADGTPYRVPGKVASLYQKAAIIFDGKQETMVLNSLYSGEGDLFGCFGPIHAGAETKPTSRALFDELDRQTDMPSFSNARTGDDADRLHARHEDIYNLEILRSMQDIQNWFSRNGFGMTDKKKSVFEYYLDDRKTPFFAALLSYGYPCQGTMVNVWTQPVQSVFPSDHIWFPMKSTTAADGDFSFVSFDLLTKGHPVDIPGHFDTKFKGRFELGHQTYNLTRLEGRLSMKQMDQDLDLKVVESSKLTAW